MARTKKKVEEVVETPTTWIVTEVTTEFPADDWETPVATEGLTTINTDETVQTGDVVTEMHEDLEHINVEIPEEEREPIIRIRYVPGITSVDCHCVEKALENANCPYEAFNINDFKDMAREDGVKWMFAVLIKDEVITNYRTALAKLREYGKI